jgi:hypothetical protein
MCHGIEDRPAVHTVADLHEAKVARPRVEPGGFCVDRKNGTALAEPGHALAGLLH